MQTQFNILNITRNNLLETIEGLSIEQLNQIPAGFNNSIIWNTAHILVTQQLLCYALSGTVCKIDAAIIDKYRKGTNIENPASPEEIAYIKKMLIETVDLLKQDYTNKEFGPYKVYTTSYNITLNTIEEAITFNNVHEGLHLGYIMAQKRTL